MKSLKIFVVEDDDWFNKLIVHTLSLNPDHEVISFKTGKDCLRRLNESPDVITIDYRLPDMTGDELLEKVSESDRRIQAIVISEQNEIQTAVDLLKKGAYDYLVKSEDIRDRLLNTIKHISENRALQKEVVILKKEVREKYAFSNAVIGQSSKIKEVFDLASKALNNNITISIVGETGTGKENLAKAIHYNSIQKEGSFVAVNVAAIPDGLIESELFGHEKGAFTGAQTRRIGKFEEADGGTLFLDEIGEMSMNMQVKLLRALQEREVVRIGSNKPVSFNCRIIVATHKDLKEEVKEGNFREDLFYRLLGLSISLPPLRERGPDIILLAEHFARLFAKDNGMPPKRLSDSAKSKLNKYHWPGNIRELKSVIDLAFVLSGEEEITSDHISYSESENMDDLMVTELTLREYTRKIVQLFMKKYNNNTKTVAEKLDIGQTTVYRVLKELEEEQ
ncbi:sigma-54-dependent transcriptional regulator [Parvicella tangerina]|uniref:Regulatory protein AtoC n=1 Tax=Parvicella tangerina TaxID=2829795 RepID=A0A916NEK6_9FLAO|nr:sigma-54 dependent transcriptional regulator [Parvicella tangerina]CAG5076391.1 Regulatory protein AtoC [Parvicella tangerina]